MMEIVASAAEWMNPEILLKNGGFWLLLLIVFLETGIFFGFFLPGDSLLFTAGLLCGTVYLDVSIQQLFFGVSAAGFSGSLVGYIFGRKTGKYLLQRNDNFFFKKKYLSVAENYYLKFGSLSLVISRFLPIARTFVPILAGLIKAKVSRFVLVNIVANLAWTAAFVLGGYWLGRLFPGLIQHIELFIVLIFLATSLPFLLAWLRKRKTQKQKWPQSGELA